jgi:hypothetical protein
MCSRPDSEACCAQASRLPNIRIDQDTSKGRFSVWFWFQSPLRMVHRRVDVGTTTLV